MSDYQVVRNGEKWEVRADGMVKGTFDTEHEATEAAKGLSQSAASVARVHGDEAERLAKRANAGGPRNAQGTARRQPKDGRAGQTPRVPRR